MNGSLRSFFLRGTPGVLDGGSRLQPSLSGVRKERIRCYSTSPWRCYSLFEQQLNPTRVSGILSTTLESPTGSGSASIGSAIYKRDRQLRACTPARSTPNPVSENGVHVWSAKLDLSSNPNDNFYNLLSADERAQTARLRALIDRQRHRLARHPADPARPLP
jgi:hypothetical protein